jgi:hypothetical protein
MDAHDGVLAHALGECGEGVRHYCQAALLVDLGDGGLEALVSLQTRLQEDPADGRCAS